MIKEKIHVQLEVTKNQLSLIKIRRNKARILNQKQKKQTHKKIVFLYTILMKVQIKIQRKLNSQTRAPYKNTI